MTQKQFALVGAGLFGEIHAQIYSSHPAAQLAVICDLNQQRARSLAASYGAEHACVDWRELIENDSLDAVSIATPDFAHAEIAIALANAGKHLLVEKPLATTIEECEHIIAASRRAHTKLMVDFHNRWSPPFHEAHSLIRRGDLGSPRLIAFRLSNTTFVPLEMLSWAAQSSVLWFLGSHAIDMVCWLLDEWPTRVYAVSRREILKDMGVDTPDFFQTTLEFPSGAIATIENCWLLPQSAPNVVDMKCEIIGSRAAASIDTTSNRMLQIDSPSGISYPDLLGSPTIHGSHVGFARESIRHFVDCVVNDTPPLATGEQGLEVTRIALAIQQSAETGQPVTVSS